MKTNSYNLIRPRFAILIFVGVAVLTFDVPIQAQYPPLTRQSTDAYLEWYCFMAGQISSGRPYAPSPQEKFWFAQVMAAQYSRLSPAQVELLSRMPLLWTTFRRSWSSLPEEQREAARQFWRLQIAGGSAYGVPQQDFTAGTSRGVPSYTGRSESTLTDRDFTNTLNTISAARFEALMNTARNFKY